MSAALRMLVLGHSDSDGSKLADAADSWPRLVVSGMPEAAGFSIELTHRILYPGRSATRFVQKELATTAPDIVIVGVSSFSAAFEFVSNRLREILGERPARVVLRLEAHAGGWTSSRHRLHSASLAPRRAARRLVGTRAASTVEATLQSYRDVFQRLAREENMQTIVLGGAGYSRHHQTMNRGMAAIIARFDMELGSAAEEHHFDWVSHTGVMGGHDAKERLYLADGVHTDETAQRLAAEAMLSVIAQRWGR